MCNNCQGGVCTPGVKCGHSCVTSKIMHVLVIVGGLNWGLSGLGMFMGINLNVVNLLLGSMPTLEAVVYLVVGIAAFGSIFGCKCKTCKGESAPATPATSSTM